MKPSSVSTPAQDATALADELLPCPFCGCAQIVQLPEKNFADFWIVCARCGTESNYHPTRESARMAWNTRATSQTPDAVRIASDFWMTISPDKEILRANVRAIGQNIADAITNALRPTPSASAGEAAKPMAYWFEHPKFGMELSLDQLSDHGRENGWIEIPLYGPTK